MSVFLICGCFLVTICGSIFVVDVCRAPEGFEDESGFRLDEASGEPADIGL